METTTALTVQQRASVALGASEHEKKLRELAKQSTEIVAITNPASYQQLHASRMVLKNERVTLEKLGKAARDDATKFSKAVIQEEQRLIGIIEPEEKRLQAIQDEYDERIEREREAKLEAEQKRIADLQDRIAQLRGNQSVSALTGSATLTEHIYDLVAIIVDDSFQEFRQQAEEAKAAGLSRLREIHAAALAHEAEQRRIISERAELARLKAEEDKRQREAAEAEAARTRKQVAEEAAARKRIEESERASRLRIEADERKAREVREEADRVARIAREVQERKAAEARAEQEAKLQAERDRLAAEAQALEKRQRQERLEQEAKDRAERERVDAENRRMAELERQKIAEQERIAKEKQRKADQLLDARTMLVTFVDRHGDIKEFAGVCRSINTYFAKHGDPRRGEPAKEAA